jgi:alpha-1,2-mannosyltransferase
MPDFNGTNLEPNYSADESTWEKVRCDKFLDASQTSIIGRLLWLPETPLIPQRYQRKWGNYCLLRRKASSST